MRGDLIRLTGIAAYGYHGGLEHERREGQEFLVDVVMQVDLAQPGASDDLADTVNYGEVAADIVQIVTGEAFDLIEKLAEVIAARILARPLVSEVEVTVHKPQAPVGVPFGDVEVVVRRRKDVPVVIALGANLEGLEGDPAQAVIAAGGRLRRLRGLRKVRISGLYGSAPVGGPTQPDFVNAVALARTSLPPAALLARLHDIEDDFGRVRQVRWGPRTLDLDLIQYGDPVVGTDVTSQVAHLLLPHPRAHERAFVLRPWLEIDPTAHLRTQSGAVVAVADLVGSVADQDVLPLQDNR